MAEGAERPAGAFSARRPSHRIWLLMIGEDFRPAGAVTDASDLTGMNFLFRGTELVAVSSVVGARAQ